MYSLKDIVSSLDDDKLMKMSKKIANIYRKFPEYKTYVDKQKEDITHCESCGEEFGDLVLPELHHDPETLTDIVYAVISDMLEKDVDFDTTDILHLVNTKHQTNSVSYLILCGCCHKRIHRQRKLKGLE